MKRLSIGRKGSPTGLLHNRKERGLRQRLKEEPNLS
jgi:hypothetical protein